MSMFELYLLTRLQPLLAVSIVGMVVSSFLAYAYWMGCVQGVENARNPSRIWTGVAVICLLLTLLLPTTRSLAIIFAGHWATNSEEVAKLPDNVVKTINSFLEAEQDD